MENSIKGFTREELWANATPPQWVQDAETVYGPLIRISGMTLPGERTIALSRFARGWRLVLQNLEPSNDVDLWLTLEGMESILLLATILRNQPIDPEHPYPALEALLDTIEQKNKQT